MICAVTTDQPPVAIGTLPLLVTMIITTNPHTAAVTALANALTQLDVVTPVHHALVANADSAKTFPSNGLIAACTIMPQAHKQQRILKRCTNLPNPPNSENLHHPQNALLHCHAVNAILIPHTTQATAIAWPSSVTLHSWSWSSSRSCSHDCHNDDCCIQRSSCPHHNDYVGHHDFPNKSNPLDTLYNCKLKKYCCADCQIVAHRYRLHNNPWDFVISFHHMDILTPLFLLEMQITLPGAQTQTKIQTTLFILMVLVNVKIPSLQLMMLQLSPTMMTMMMIVICILVKTPPKLMTLLMSAISQTPRPKTTVTGTTPNWMHNPQLG